MTGYVPASLQEPGERWEPVPGWADLYAVSSHGRVFAVRSGHVLVAGANSPGYRHVTFYDRERRQQVRIHRLVAEVFIGVPTGPVVRHLDGDLTNNDVSNVAYGSHAENAQDTVRHGRARNGTTDATECSNGHPWDEENTYVWNGARQCRTCKREWDEQHAASVADSQRRYREANRDAINARNRARYAAQKGQAA